MFQSTHSLRSATRTSFYPLSLTGFNPRTPCGVRPGLDKASVRDLLFQSTHSLRSATAVFDNLMAGMDVSIHALLAECDLPGLASIPDQSGFNPRTPCGVRQLVVVLTCHPSVVSIHALLAECDCPVFGTVYGICGFNPRTPCGVRLKFSILHYVYYAFQSTHSLRSATQPTNQNRK